MIHAIPRFGLAFIPTRRLDESQRVELLQRAALSDREPIKLVTMTHGGHLDRFIPVKPWDTQAASNTKQAALKTTAKNLVALLVFPQNGNAERDADRAAVDLALGLSPCTILPHQDPDDSLANETSRPYIEKRLAMEGFKPVSKPVRHIPKPASRRGRGVLPEKRRSLTTRRLVESLA